jgi:transcriptional regulator with XRE-family HTH domain
MKNEHADNLVAAITKNFRANLRESLRAQKITTRSFGQMTGMCQSQISDLQGGKHTPTILSICRVSAALGCDPIDLISTPKKKI